MRTGLVTCDPYTALCARVSLLQVFFDMEQGGEDLGRIEIGLFGDSVNKTVTNFRELAKRVSRSRDAAVGVVRESFMDTCFIPSELCVVCLVRCNCFT